MFECSIYFRIKKFSIYLLNSNSGFPVDIGHNFCSNYLMNNIVINWVGGVQQTEFYHMYTYFIFTNIVCIALIYRSLVEWLLK